MSPIINVFILNKIKYNDHRVDAHGSGDQYYVCYYIAFGWSFWVQFPPVTFVHILNFMTIY